MLGAQWADEEIDKAKKSSGSVDSETSKIIGAMVLLYIAASFISSIQFIALFDRKFARSGAGFSIAMVIFVVMGVIYFWGMMKFKSDFVWLYCCLVAGAMCVVSHWLPAFW